MTRPAVFAGMGEAFVSSLGNVDVSLSRKGEPLESVSKSLRGILRAVREADLLELEGVSAEGVRFTLSLHAVTCEPVRNGDQVEILTSDDGRNIGDRFIILSHVDDGRSMKRFYLGSE
ncbi:hypothetical protein ACI0FM_08650 [Paenochrobactrum sp. BZR 588]|uniref:hypothetical protein n=1 Tax=unclassified Paenochrobactrum TaxID=2639760 RepID=UPI0038538290